MFNFSKFKNQDIVLVFLIAVLSIFGLTTVFSTTFFHDLGVSDDFRQQLVFFAVGVVIYTLITCLDSNYLNQPKIQFLIWAICIVTLVLVIARGEVINGTKRWINLGVFSLQPSEFAKLAIIMISATLFATSKEVQIFKLLKFTEKHKSHSKWKQILSQPVLAKLVINLIAVLAIVVLIWRQPSLGNAIITFGLWLLMVSTILGNTRAILGYILVLILGLNLILQIVNFNFVYQLIKLPLQIGGVDLLLASISLIVILVLTRFLRLNLIIVIVVFSLGAAIALGINFAWNNLLSEYQQDRITAFANPDADPLGSQWQVNQAKIAIGSGQVFGKGLLNGTQSNLGLLPFAYTDFAYAAYAEQFGLTGCIILIGLFYCLVSRILQIADRAEDNFGKLICIGVAIMLSLNIIINIGMNLGIMPVTGVPLPFLSYGGSAVLVNFIGFGLVQMIYAETDRSSKAEKLGEIGN
jgi:rod shape determining protein RodA